MKHHHKNHTYQTKSPSLHELHGRLMEQISQIVLVQVLCI